MTAFQSVKGKLITFSLCVTIIPIALIATTYYLKSREVIKKQTLDGLTAVAESRRLHVLEFMEGRKGRTVDFSSDGFIRDSLETISQGGPEVEVAVKKLNRHLLVNKMPLDKWLVAVEVIDLNGKVVSSTETTQIGKDVSGQEFFTKGRKGVFADPRCRFVDYLNTKCLFVSHPLTSKNTGDPIGVIVNVSDMGALSEGTTQRAGLGETGEVYLVDRDKLMLTESRFLDGAPLKQIVDTEPIRMNTNIKGKEKGREMTGIYPDYRGEPVIGASMYLPEYGWTLLAEIDKAEAFANLKTLAIVAIVLGCVAIGAAAGTGVSISMSLAKPINKLTGAVNKFRGGDREARANIHRGDELGVLANSFDGMAQELSALTTDLEKRVAERTAESEGRAKELARSNTELQQFAYVASHDLQEPLRMVQGYTQLIARRYKGKLGEEADEFVNYIVDGVSRMQGLINALLTYSRVGTHGGLFEPMDCNILLKQALANLQVAIEESNADVTSTPLPVVKCDATQLVQLFQNLIGNAIKFRATGKPPRVDVSSERKGNEWVFSVKDNGIGIDPQHFDRIFLIFQRLHTKEQYAGSGIGLSICQKIVERHGGRIWVESVSGQGTTFYFTIST